MIVVTKYPFLQMKEYDKHHLPKVQYDYCRVWIVYLDFAREINWVNGNSLLVIV